MNLGVQVTERVCGAMDNASAYGAEDSRFDPWQTRIISFKRSFFQLLSFFFFLTQRLFLTGAAGASQRETHTNT